MRRRAATLLFGVVVTLGTGACSASDDDEEASEPAEPVSTTTAPVSSTAAVTTTIDPASIAPLDGEEGFDLDREIAPDAQAESLGPIGATETTIATDEGEIQVGGGDIPDLAAAFPIPDGFEVQITTEVPGEVGFSGRVDGELDALVEFYEAALAEAGYDIIERQDVSGVLAAMEITGPLEGDVVISQEPGRTDGWTILVALAEPGSGS